MPVSDSPIMPSVATLPELIGNWAERHGDRLALTFVDDQTQFSWTYLELWQRACGVASRLQSVDVDLIDRNPPRAALLFPPGLDFVAGFLGAQIAGWIPVPTCYPKLRREMPRLNAAVSDCQPIAIVGDAKSLEGIGAENDGHGFAGLTHVITPQSSRADDFIDPKSLDLDPESLAFLQYTSGSTSNPNGVMVRHRNLMANLEAIRRGFRIEVDHGAVESPVSGVFWLPFYHDMGLIGGILTPLFCGGTSVLMSPQAFLQRPIRWLQAISDHRAQFSGAPNFAYQLCTDRISPDQTNTIDLSCWKTAFCGAEPILHRTLYDFASRFSSCGFSSTAFYPCYGLAEATLLASGGDGPAEPTLLTVRRSSIGTGVVEICPEGRGKEFQKLVSSGVPAFETELKIIDPANSSVMEEGRIGEIWLRGSSVTAGYWNNAEISRLHFDACTAGGESGYCRTGDLGFLSSGQLFVTGRLKDLIILRGRNLFPQDIEVTAGEVVGSGRGHVAAFSVDGPRGEALSIVAELPRNIQEDQLPSLVRSIRRNVIEVHEVDPRHVLLVRLASVPLTSSGKIRRNECRVLFDTHGFKVKYRYDRASGSEQTPLEMPALPAGIGAAEVAAVTESVSRWMTQWLIARAGVPLQDIALDKPFAVYGLDSMTAVELSGELEDWSGVELTPESAFAFQTIGALSEMVANRLAADAQ